MISSLVVILKEVLLSGGEDIDKIFYCNRNILYLTLKSTLSDINISIPAFF